MVLKIFYFSVFALEAGMPCDAPSRAVPADIHRHTDAELRVITA